VGMVTLLSITSRLSALNTYKSEAYVSDSWDGDLASNTSELRLKLKLLLI